MFFRSNWEYLIWTRGWVFSTLTRWSVLISTSVLGRRLAFIWFWDFCPNFFVYLTALGDKKLDQDLSTMLFDQDFQGILDEGIKMKLCGNFPFYSEYYTRNSCSYRYSVVISVHFGNGHIMNQIFHVWTSPWSTDNHINIFSTNNKTFSIY